MTHPISPPRRWKNGRKARPKAVAQIEEANRAREEVEMATVLAQPHRLGNRSQKCESALGRFCLAHKLREEIYSAGGEYASLKRKWRAAKGVPMSERMSGVGVEPDDATVYAWGARIDRCEEAILDCQDIDPRAYGPAAIGCVEWLVVDDKDLPATIELPDVFAGLLALTLALGFLERKDLALTG